MGEFAVLEDTQIRLTAGSGAQEKGHVETGVWESAEELQRALAMHFEVSRREWGGCKAWCTEALTPEGPLVQLWLFWAVPAGITSATLHLHAS